MLVLCGLVVVTDSNSAAWADHVRDVNRVLKAALPTCIAVTIACLLGVRSLAGLGSGPTQVLGAPDH